MRDESTDWPQRSLLRGGGALAVAALAAVICSAWRVESVPEHAERNAQYRDMAPRQAPMPEIIVYASDLPKRALSEFAYWNDASSPDARMVGTANNGDELDPPPENDPHVTFKVTVAGGVPYRCWIHMKVGARKGKSQANRLWVQLSGAVDAAGKETLKPGTRSYLTAQGPATEGWTWVGCDPAEPNDGTLIYFRTSGEVTVRLQAGMEGVGFDQFLLSSTRFLESPPTDAVVAKPQVVATP